MTTFIVFGRIINRNTRAGVPGLRVEVWDKDLICNDLVGSTVTDQQGAYRIEFDESYFQDLFPDRLPDIFFKIFDGNRLIKSTEDSVLWNVKAGATAITIEVNLPDTFSISNLQTSMKIPPQARPVNRIYSSFSYRGLGDIWQCSPCLNGIRICIYTGSFIMQPRIEFCRFTG